MEGRENVVADIFGKVPHLCLMGRAECLLCHFTELHLQVMGGFPNEQGGTDEHHDENDETHGAEVECVFPADVEVLHH
ncbi:MAG: hypothetical protein MZV70_16675 [Desulfobacterales bacterium]|nr:hypothetical protein [Desulfobacterales bacterium]